MADSTKTETFGQKIRALQAQVKPLFASAQTEDEDAAKAAQDNVLKLRKQITAAKKLLHDLEHEFDAAVDMRDMGTFGEGFLPEVTRIRKKRVPSDSDSTTKVDELADLDF